MKPIYVLGTGLSQNGSACLLKNGKICVAIEKERITRRKQDGFNDTLAIEYCLNAEGIKLKDVDLVVQNANYGMFEYGNTYFDGGARLFANHPDIPVITISHHLAHAYYGIGTSPFEQGAILVIDGSGSLMDDVMDIEPETIIPEVPAGLRHVYAEKDSYYFYTGTEVKTVCKDFSPFGYGLKGYPMYPDVTMHSIGGIYGAATNYCFNDASDPGKLMGLAPYGRRGVYDFELYDLKNGNVYVNYDCLKNFRKPVLLYKSVFDHFQYYADIAYWIQKETERAILYVINARHGSFPADNLIYTGGVALNAVANARIVNESKFANTYFTPAAGDNGLAIGCAYYGWLNTLKKPKINHDGRSSFGKTYTQNAIDESLEGFVPPVPDNVQAVTEALIKSIRETKDFATDKPYTLRWVIAEVGIYTFRFEGNGRCADAATYLADCTIFIKGVTLIKIVNDPGQLQWDPSVRCEGDLSTFMQHDNWKNLLRRIKTELGSVRLTSSRYYYKSEDVSADAAVLMANGKVIGWFQDKSEFGPRALGFRSILADPRRKDVRDFINARIKFREEFRPFAPSVLLEDAREYFDLEGQSPYMLEVATVKEKWREMLATVMHLDNTSRIQTVTREWSEKYYRLIKEFKQLTGLPIVLNTSLNKKGMPIVETPAQALNFFYECELDAMVIGDYVVVKDENVRNSLRQKSISVLSDLV